MEMGCPPLSLTLPSSVVRHQPAIAATATESGDFCSRNVQRLKTQMTPPKADYEGEKYRSQQDRSM